MPNDLHIQPDFESSEPAAPAGSAELDLNFGFPVEDKNIFAELFEAVRDVFFPPKLPPLVLTSKPIPVPDPMAVKRNPWAVAASAVLNGGIIALLLYAVVKPMIQTKPPVTTVQIELTQPKIDDGPHGGGGSPEKAPPVQGKVPPKMQAPMAPPKLLEAPPPTVDIVDDIPDTKLPNFGVANSNVKLGTGGNGTGGGVGNGHGMGYGDGSGGNWGGGLEHVGGKVSAPYQINQVEAEFSDEARRAKYQGIVVVAIIVDKQGNPQNPRVVRALGMGLDEKAIEAVMKYKFHPAMREGKPVAVPVNVEINFRLY